MRGGWRKTCLQEWGPEMCLGKHGDRGQLRGRGAVGAGPAFSILFRDPYTTCAHSPGTRRALSAAHDLTATHQNSTSSAICEKEVALLMRCSFHKGGHLACSPSSGVLAHICSHFFLIGWSSSTALTRFHREKSEAQGQASMNVSPTCLQAIWGPLGVRCHPEGASPHRAGLKPVLC